jgi:hypothetical protein
MRKGLMLFYHVSGNALILDSIFEGDFSCQHVISIIHEVLRPGRYNIQYEYGRVVSNAWNIEHLCPFYP